MEPPDPTLPSAAGAYSPVVSDPGLIDLRHLDRERVIAAYLLDTPDGPALFDCGPATTVETLRDELAARGLAVGDLRHLLLSHIHFDHAGAAGVLVRENPRLAVHVSAVGAPHLVDPARLERSARRLYGDTFDTLWGSLVPVPEENVRIVGERVLDFDCFPSPGHATHHVCYLRDGLLLAGDAAGVRIDPAVRVIPPTPPPDIDIEDWDATLDEIERRAPDRLALIHFGLFDDVARHLAELRERLHRDSELVARGATEAEFVATSRAQLGDDAGRFEHAVPASQCYQGLARYWERRRAANAG
jgi:glyoxylase-like metal-dependent hydrolase (beta-lactamase superfamily II)